MNAPHRGKKYLVVDSVVKILGKNYINHVIYASLKYVRTIVIKICVLICIYILQKHANITTSWFGWGADEKSEVPMGGSLHSQVEHHVRDKFATPVLYGIDILLFDDIFSTYT